MKEQGVKVDYLYGTMIEVPRAAVTADELAQTAEFFSFGTNDLTQMTFGYSRDDVEQLPSRLPEEGNPGARPLPDAWTSAASASSSKMAVHKGRGVTPRPQVRHLRRTRRRPEERSLLPRSRPRLRKLLPVPSAHRPPGRGPRRDRGSELEEEVGIARRSEATECPAQAPGISLYFFLRPQAEDCARGRPPRPWHGQAITKSTALENVVSNTQPLLVVCGPCTVPARPAKKLPGP